MCKFVDIFIRYECFVTKWQLFIIGILFVNIHIAAISCGCASFPTKGFMSSLTWSGI